ncbi:MAG: thioredoxin domain-containing protein [Candidatus Omnitrophica bacterium]|nr:thioredoxin domain-containing protein [Candidatus Omnitrophota bacterium]
MVEKTLDEMAKGGIWDHLGGGFHRYSTDARWFLPHFEKMLYDQAILAKSYLEAYQADHKENYAKVVREVFDYVLRDLRDSQGAFYSAEDADSFDAKAAKKREGAFYVWEKQEILNLLGNEKGEIVSFVFGVEPSGNIQSDPHGEFPRKNVLSLVQRIEETTQKFKRPIPEIEQIIQESKKKLFEARSKRPRPHLDDKVLTDWNGLMISSLAFGSRVLGEPKYAKAAQESADFILTKLVRSDGRLLHRYRDGEASILGTIEDYAFFIHGLFDLYEATFEPRYLIEAKRLTGEMVRLFWDEEGSGFFFTAGDAEKLIVRQKEIYDGAIPSGNSLAALDLLRVGRLTMDKNFGKKAEDLLSSFSRSISQNPEAYPQMLVALDFALGPSREIVFTGKSSEEIKAFLHSVYSRFIPNKVVAFHPTEGKEREFIEEITPFIKNQLPLKGKPTVYVCENYVCKFPVTEVSELEKLL